MNAYGDLAAPKPTGLAALVRQMEAEYADEAAQARVEGRVFVPALAVAECARRDIALFDLCADGGAEAWMVVQKEIADLVSHAGQIGAPFAALDCFPEKYPARLP